MSYEAGPMLLKEYQLTVLSAGVVLVDVFGVL